MYAEMAGVGGPIPLAPAEEASRWPTGGFPSTVPITMGFLAALMIALRAQLPVNGSITFDVNVIGPGPANVWMTVTVRN